MVRREVVLGDIVATADVAVAQGSTLREAFSLMHRNRKGAVAVCKGPKPLGVITERDAVGLLFAGTDLDEPVEQYATRPPIMAHRNRTVGYGLGLMVQNKIRRLVVVGDEREFAGIVTQGDLLVRMEEDYYRSTLKVRHIVDHLKILVSAGREDSVEDVLDKMVKHSISAVPVVEDGVAVGIITEKDILRLACDKVPLRESVSRHMSSPVFSAGYETPMTELVKAMQARGIRRVVVSDARGHAVSMVTHRDLVRNLEGDYSEFLERKLEYSKDILNLLPEMLVELVDTGRDVLVVWANEKALGIFGREIIDKPATELVPAKMWKSIYRTVLKRGKVEDVRFKKDDDIYELSGFYMPLEKSSERGRMELILRNITEEVMLASVDPLTQVYNRRYMNEFLAKEAKRGKRMKRGFAVVLVDIDNFKGINDTFGHPAGDAVLREVVALLLAGTREYDVVGRYGGEEFLIIMPEIERETAVRVVERVRGSIARKRFAVADNGEISITASFGVACFDRDGTSPDNLLLRADERLYKAKERGKNRVVSA